MKFKKSAPRVLIGAVILVVATISLGSYFISHRMVDSFEKAEFTLMGKILQTKFRDAEFKAISTAEKIAAMPTVEKYFSEKKRPELLAAVKDSFDILKDKYGIRTASFFLPPGEAFLRLHRPADFGDDVSSYRKLIVEVNREQANRKGIEIAATGLTLSGTTPVKNPQGAHVGNFEIGLDVGPLLDELKKAYGFELALFLDEELLRSTAKLMKPDIFSAQNRVGSYIKFYSTHPDLLQTLVTDSDLNITDDNSYVRDSSDIPYGVLVQPLYNYTKKPIGVIVIAKDFSQTLSAAGQAVAWQGVLGVASIILLVGVVLVTIRGLILRPLEVLTTHITALANKESVSDKPTSDDWCDEMKLLNSECERLVSENKSDHGAIK